MKDFLRSKPHYNYSPQNFSYPLSCTCFPLPWQLMTKVQVCLIKLMFIKTFAAEKSLVALYNVESKHFCFPKVYFQT